PTPGATTTLTFGDAALAGASYTATNNIANPFALNGLTFTNNAGSTVTIAPATSGGALNFSGTTPTTTVGAGAASVTAPVTLSADATVAGTSATGSLTFGAAVSGGGANNLVMTSAGTLTLAGGG